MKLIQFKSWPEKRRRWTLRLAAAFVAYSLVGFFLLPLIAKWQLVKRLPESTKRQAVVRQVRMNPWTLSLTIRGLALTEPDGRVFASWEEFYANFQLSSLFRRAWTFKEIHLNDPFGEVILRKDGRLNFANMFETTNAPPAKPPGKTAIPRVLVFGLSVTNGHVGFADLSRKTPFHTDYQPINFHLRRFTTKPDKKSPYSFEAASDTGRSLAWAGTITAQPPASSGTLRVAGVPLPKFAPYFEEITRAQLTDGTLDLADGYWFALGTNGMDLVVSNMVVTASSLQLKDPETRETLLAVPSYELRDGALDWRARKARVGSLVVTEPTALVRRRADGSINLPSLVLRRITTASPGTNAPAGAPWIFTLDDYRIERGTVEIEDATVPAPFHTLLKPVSVRVEHFTTAPDSDAALQAEVTTEAAESVKLAVSYSINPIRAGGTLKVSGLDLKKYQPYLQPFFRGLIADGKTDVALEFHHHRNANVDYATVSNAVVHASGLQIKSEHRNEVATRDFCRPFRGFLSCERDPTAGAVGYFLSPLRG